MHLGGGEAQTKHSVKTGFWSNDQRYRIVGRFQQDTSVMVYFTERWQPWMNGKEKGYLIRRSFIYVLEARDRESVCCESNID